MNNIEYKLRKYNQIKTDLLKISKCLEHCDKAQKELYQNVCIEYSMELKKIKNSLESVYDVKIFQCCSEEQT
ncbi:phosphoglycerate-specific signal transduction histidine kinase [Lysinibacillus sp. RC79]